MAKITSIQVKRGTKEALTRVLVGDNKPKSGEPIYETDTYKLKIGDGINDYGNLGYIAGDGSIVIEDALDGQILMYSEAQKKWLPVNLVDGKSISYTKDGLSITGYPEAEPGYTPISNADKGLVWQPALSDKEVADAIEKAQTASSEAQAYRDTAQQHAANAQNSAQLAQEAYKLTEEIVGKKFWFGTIDEYNTEVVDKGKVTECTVYIIRDNL